MNEGDGDSEGGVPSDNERFFGGDRKGIPISLAAVTPSILLPSVVLCNCSSSDENWLRSWFPSAIFSGSGGALGGLKPAIGGSTLLILMI